MRNAQRAIKFAVAPADAGAARSGSVADTFIDNDYRGFLKRRLPDLEEQVKGGNFVNTKGEVIGKHEGYPFYTVGQRKGLGMAFGQPMFVTEIQPETNTVILGELDELIRNSMSVYQVNSMKYERIPDGLEALTKVRYKDAGTMSQLSHTPDGKISVEFHANVNGIAPGQSAVFMEGDDVIGGGIIYKELPKYSS